MVRSGCGKLAKATQIKYLVSRPMQIYEVLTGDSWFDTTPPTIKLTSESAENTNHKPVKMRMNTIISAKQTILQSHSKHFPDSRRPRMLGEMIASLLVRRTR